MQQQIQTEPHYERPEFTYAAERLLTLYIPTWTPMRGLTTDVLVGMQHRVDFRVCGTLVTFCPDPKTIPILEHLKEESPNVALRKCNLIAVRNGAEFIKEVLMRAGVSLPHPNHLLREFVQLAKEARHVVGVS